MAERTYKLPLTLDEITVISQLMSERYASCSKSVDYRFLPAFYSAFRAIKAAETTAIMDTVKEYRRTHQEQKNTAAST